MLTLRALVIDDSRVMRNMVMQALRQSRLANFEFAEAADGADALTKFDPAAVDICFVDWNMPTMTGVDFVKHARAKPGAEKTAMVMVTSEKTVAKIDEALDSAGADAYICKPFTVDDLKVKLEKVMNRLEADRATAGEAAGFFSRLFN